MYRNLAVLICAFVLLGCQDFASLQKSTPTATSAQDSPADQSNDQSGIESILMNLPVGWGDLHLPVVFGPAIHVIDLEQMRYDLNIPNISGVDDYQQKQDFFLTYLLNTQGVEFFPPAFAPATRGFYEKWGWDAADIQQALYLPDYQIAIVQGAYDAEIVGQHLRTKAFAETTIGSVRTFTSKDGWLRFVLLPDRMVMQEGGDGEDLATLIQFLQSGALAFPGHPAASAVIGELSGSWGAIFSPSADITALNQQLSEQELSPERSAIYAAMEERYNLETKPINTWDFMAISFYGVEEPELRFIYHYPTSEAMAGQQNYVHNALTETPMLSSQGRFWGDLLTVISVETHDETVVATAQTSASELLGNAFRQRDFYAFLPYNYE